MRIFLVVSFLFLHLLSYSQSSLIKDIMSLDPVVLSIAELTQEPNDEYQGKLDNELSEVNEKLQKLDLDYQNNVNEVMTDYQEVIPEGNKRKIKAQKKMVVSKVYSLSMELLKAKKKIVMNFNSNMTPELRRLPTMINQDKETELRQIIEEYNTTFKDEFYANKEVINDFDDMEHVTIVD